MAFKCFEILLNCNSILDYSQPPFKTRLIYLCLAHVDCKVQRQLLNQADVSRTAYLLYFILKIGLVRDRKNLLIHRPVHQGLSLHPPFDHIYILEWLYGQPCLWLEQENGSLIQTPVACGRQFSPLFWKCLVSCAGDQPRAVLSSF